MGNCLVIQDRKKEIKIISVDGSSQVLRVPSPSRLMKVHDDSLREPLPAASVGPVKAPAAGTVRVKLVISKRELKKMLDKEGMSLDDMVSLMRKEASSDREQEEFCCGGWRPALESIPEGSEIDHSGIKVAIS